ncbi:preprotein translocase subunit YajC [Actinoplanes sp. TRM 88003]|uniref:Preprotein translocase subunit YajC n=1 Tax=Paractinoplanes aksuensis TaxID=2939490 RepID=A0ABT1E1E0_9ACTN|nr:preprotein translocase subunit YajC [Actinoplanes aksuensis]MCO8276927.1 preprotein translocase subunit YajC [Actinoplanes aksuensis]
MIQAAEASGGGSFTPLLLIVLLFAVMYFLMIRPQQKRRREAQQMQNALGPGDRIVTIGGLHGSVVAVADDVVTLEIADGVHVDFARPAIARVVSQTAVPAEAPAEEVVEEPVVEEPIVNPVTDTRKKD